MKNYLNKKSNLLMIEKIKRTFDGKMSWEFEKPEKEFKFLNINTKLILEKGSFEFELVIGSRKIFINYSEFIENIFFDIFSGLSDCEVDDNFEKGKNDLLFTSVITELTVEKYKQTKEYKMSCLYDSEFKKRFEDKIIYEYYQ
jgi:hypothetical protein